MAVEEATDEQRGKLPLGLVNPAKEASCKCRKSRYDRKVSPEECLREKSKGADGKATP